MSAISSSSETPETFWRRSSALSTAAWATDWARWASSVSAPTWLTKAAYCLPAVLVVLRAATASARLLEPAPVPEPAVIAAAAGMPVPSVRAVEPPKKVAP